MNKIKTKEVSREEKLNLCRKAYDVIFNNSYRFCKVEFICVAIEIFLPLPNKGQKPLKAYEVIPELLEYKPEIKSPNNHWFNIDEDGMEKRRKILLELIKRFENG
jgi:hypothetical protein